MEAMREAWTDERLDDLTNRVDEGFARADVRIDRFEDQVDARFDKVDARFERFEDKVDSRFANVDARFDKLDMRFEWLWRLMLAGYITAVLGFIFS